MPYYLDNCKEMEIEYSSRKFWLEMRIARQSKPKAVIMKRTEPAGISFDRLGASITRDFSQETSQRTSFFFVFRFHFSVIENRKRSSEPLKLNFCSFRLRSIPSHTFRS